MIERKKLAYKHIRAERKLYSPIRRYSRFYGFCIKKSENGSKTLICAAKININDISPKKGDMMILPYMSL